MDEPGVGRFLVAMSLQGVVFIVLLFLMELQCVRTLLNLCRRHKKVREEEKMDGCCGIVRVWMFAIMMV